MSVTIQETANLLFTRQAILRERFHQVEGDKLLEAAIVDESAFLLAVLKDLLELAEAEDGKSLALQYYRRVALERAR
jgi:hypothetical protein